MSAPRATSSSPQRRRTGGSTRRWAGAARRAPEGGAVPVQHGGEGAGLSRRCGVGLQVLGGERPWPAGPFEDRPEGPEVARPDLALGEERELEEEHVAAAPALLPVVQQELAHDRRVRNVQGRQPRDALRKAQGAPPGDGAPPVVGDDVDRRRARAGSEVVQEAPEVFGERVEAVGAYPFGLAGEVVAAQVGSDHPPPGCREHRDLLSPAPPELGKSVQQQHRLAVGRPGLDEMESDSRQIEEALAERQAGLLGGEAGQCRIEKHQEVTGAPSRTASTRAM